MARRSWTLRPAEHDTRGPAVCLPGQLDRIEAVQGDTTLEAERRRVLGGPVEHAATTLFELPDAEITEGSVWVAGARVLMLPGSVPRAVLSSRGERIERAALDCTWVGNRYFGHWLTDDSTLHLLVREHADPIGLMRPPYTHEPGYCHEWNLTPRKLSRARVRSLLVCEDHSQNSLKRDRYGRLRTALVGRGGSGRKSVYLRRGSSGVLRLLMNEDEVESALIRRGFTVVDPARDGFAELLAACSGADCVVGVEGSAMAHGVMTVRGGGSLVTLQPPWRFNCVFKDYTDCLGLRYAFLVGARSGDGFRIDVGELERTLDLCG
ncbi:MAG TPA: glycosyltransferase family 61 protein [Myxococcota bacterium]|nr:glycosyltransferase family 61 protein [Myxococcota bacterium]